MNGLYVVTWVLCGFLFVFFVCDDDDNRKVLQATFGAVIAWPILLLCGLINWMDKVKGKK